MSAHQVGDVDDIEEATRRSLVLRLPEARFGKDLHISTETLGGTPTEIKLVSNWGDIKIHPENWPALKQAVERLLGEPSTGGTVLPNPNPEQILVKLQEEAPQSGLILTDERSSQLQIGTVVGKGEDVYCGPDEGDIVCVSKGRGSAVPESPNDSLVFQSNHPLRVYDPKDIMVWWKHD